MYFSFCRCIVSSCVVAVFTITLVSPTNSVSLTHRSIEPNARSLFELYKENKGFCHANVFCQWSTPLISEAILSSSKWNPSDSVSLIFRTASLPVEKVSYNVDLYRIEPRPLIHPVELPAAILRIPKHVHVATIIRKLIISESSEYTLTFTPPSFLQSGKYLLVMSQHRSGRRWFHGDIAKTVQISAEASFAFDRLPSVILSSPTDPTGISVSRLDVDTLPLVISNIDNLADLCSLCSASESQQRICDTTFSSVQYPSDLVFTEYYDHIAPSALLDADRSHGRLTTTSTCRLAHIDNMIRKLEYKYSSIFAAQGYPIKPSPYDSHKSHIQSKLKYPDPSPKSAKAPNSLNPHR
ncbi:hypothetical protein BKA69DRAFT_382490 [Paraphysoderma sedebokerense]|nr:hypothetical protein BKA69DRAFT_382490 [Paraphysoderma sedebokerense]